jgi:hypothetical protein
MRHSGQIVLYDFDHNPVSIKVYESRWDRNLIICNWKKIYANAFYNCYYVISPSVKTDDIDLFNFKMKRHPFEEKVFIIRVVQYMNISLNPLRRIEGFCFNPLNLLKMSKKGIKSITARTYRDKYGFRMPTATLAQIMYDENKLMFKDKEDARAILRYIEGKKGNQDKKK